MATHTYRYKRSSPVLTDVGRPVTVAATSPVESFIDLTCDDEAKGDLDEVMAAQCWEYVKQDPATKPAFVVLQEGTDKPYALEVNATGNLEAKAL